MSNDILHKQIEHLNFVPDTSRYECYDCPTTTEKPLRVKFLKDVGMFKAGEIGTVIQIDSVGGIAGSMTYFRLGNDMPISKSDFTTDLEGDVPLFEPTAENEITKTDELLNNLKNRVVGSSIQQKLFYGSIILVAGYFIYKQIKN